jgi:LacI family transcriptional regulator
MVDVARAAGVAVSTVSRVVNGDPKVGAEFAERVRAAIAELGYRPDEQARQLRRGFSGIIGFAVRELSGRNPVLMAFELAAKQGGLAVLGASTSDDPDREREVVLSMARRSFDGVVLEPIGDGHGYLAPEIAAGLAVVAVDRPVTGAEVDAVLSDNAAGIRMAYQHLRAYGHTRIGYLGDHERIFTGAQRAGAFRACLAAEGRSAEGLVHSGEVTQPGIDAALASLLASEQPPTALISGNSESTVAMLTYLSAHVAPEHRPAVIAFDDFPLAGLLNPPVTVVAQDTQTLAHAAFRLITARIKDRERDVERVTVPVSLIARGSGERPPK